MRRLDPSETEQASLVLARAFQEDPLQSWVLPDPEERRALSPPMFAAIVRYGVLAGDVRISDDVSGVAVWWPPEHRQMDMDKLDEAGFTTLPSVIGEEAFGRFTGALDYIESFHQNAVPGPHWYAMVLGVDPAHHGRGVGRQLLNETFARADAAGLPCYLETAQPKNVRFYQNSGFELLQHGTVPDTPLEFWSFRRDPQPI